MSVPSFRVTALRRREQHPNLVAAWGFDEGSGTSARDSSEHNVPLTVDPGLTWVTGHTGGSALSNTGAGSAYRPWNLTTQITMMAWARPTDLTAGTNRALAGVWTTADATGATHFALWSQRGDFGTSDVLQANARINGGLVFIAHTALALNTWVHVALTYNGTTLRLFRDGVEVASTVNAGTLDTSLFNFSVAPSITNAQVDDVRIFNTPLTAAQITEQMNQPVAP
jgi:hypothetical protein